MMNLIRKEFIILKKYWWYVILYSIFAVIVFSTSVEAGRSSYIIAAVGITYMLIQYSCAIEDKNKTDRIFNSLPIHRTNIVLSKYGAGILLSIFSVVAVGLSGILVSSLPFVHIERIRPEDMIGIFVATWLMIALYLPVYFKFGYIKAKFFNMGIFFVFFFGTMYISQQLSKYANYTVIKILTNFVSNKGDLAISGVIILINILILGVSALISTKIYGKREFN